MKHFNFLFQTGKHADGLILRLTLSIILFAHGAQMLFGWFGGYGLNSSMEYLTGKEGLPSSIAISVILLQFLGSLALLAGFYARLFATAFTFLFAGMIINSHLPYGFFMNWSGDRAGEGFEYHLLAIGLSLVLLIRGAGSCSIDLVLSSKSNQYS